MRARVRWQINFLGKIIYSVCAQIIRGLENIADQIREVLGTDKKVMKLAESLYQKKSLLVMGRGYNYATCLEGALVSFFLTWGGTDSPPTLPQQPISHLISVSPCVRVLESQGAHIPPQRRHFGRRTETRPVGSYR